MTAAPTIAIRSVRFDHPPESKPVWTPAKPEFSCAANSVSLMMPTIEPYFVRSIRSALADIDGPLRAETEAYVHQEAQHHRLHRAFNRMLESHYPALTHLERLQARTYKAVESRGSRRFNIGFAAASETMAYSAARWAAEHRVELFTGADDVSSSLFLWHLAEEVEHKSVAHDVYRELYSGKARSRLTYLAAMAIALFLVVSFVVGGTTVLLGAERRLHKPIAWVRLTRWSIGFAFELLTNLVISVLPGFHPSDFADPLWYEVWLQEFDADRGTFPVWHRSGRPPADS